MLSRGSALASAVVLLSVASAEAASLGLFVDDHLKTNAPSLFGIAAPLAASAPASATTGYRKQTSTAADAVLLAPGLTATYVTRSAGDHLDMMVLYPPAAPTHIIACIETRREVIGKKPDGTDRYQPSVQRINLSTGGVTTLLRGMDRCDGVRVTAWNTIVVNEETVDGRVYEIISPLKFSEATVTDRATGAVTSANVAQRPALPKMAWEGFEVTRDGVVYGSDELRPGTTGPDTDGGALYKFIPTTPWSGETVTRLSESPLVAGKSYALRISCVEAKVQVGQGCQEGVGSWVEVAQAVARADAEANGATGFYRPEDLQFDKFYTGTGIRACSSITGRVQAASYGRVVCFVDRKPLAAPKEGAGGAIVHTVELQSFIEGDKQFNSFDNLDFQAGRKNLHVVEDFPNGDIWSCLQDGRDRDLESDGCIRWLSVKDSSGEPTGIIFDATGKTAYVAISHTDDSAMPKVGGFPTDDLLKITGFK